MSFSSELINCDKTLLFDFGNIEFSISDDCCERIELISENVIDKTIIIRIGSLYYQGQVYNDEETIFSYEINFSNEENLSPVSNNNMMRIFIKQLMLI